MTIIIEKLNKVIETIMVVLIIAMVCGNFWQIFTRFILNNAASWTEEFLRYALIWLTMLGVPYAYGKDKHIAIEFITNTYSPKSKIVNQLIIEVLVLFISIFVMIFGGMLVTLNAAGQTSPALGMPMQYYYLGVPVCGVLMILYTIPRISRQFNELKSFGKEGN